jgi:hypothetical protein
MIHIFFDIYEQYVSEPEQSELNRELTGVYQMTLSVYVVQSLENNMHVHLEYRDIQLLSDQVSSSLQKGLSHWFVDQTELCPS